MKQALGNSRRYPGVRNLICSENRTANPGRAVLYDSWHKQCSFPQLFKLQNYLLPSFCSWFIQKPHHEAFEEPGSQHPASPRCHVGCGVRCCHAARTAWTSISQFTSVSQLPQTSREERLSWWPTRFPGHPAPGPKQQQNMLPHEHPELWWEGRFSAATDELTTYFAVIVSHFSKDSWLLCLFPTTQHAVGLWSQHQSWGKPKCVQHLLGDLPEEFNFNSITWQPEQKQLPASHRQREGLCSVCMDQWLKTQKQGSGKRQVLKERKVLRQKIAGGFAPFKVWEVWHW